MTTITGSTVFITGANGGLGRHLVAAALERGAAKVYAAARTPEAHADERIVGVSLDLADPASIERAADAASDTTILVNNAAIFPRGSLLTGPWDEITAVLESNLVGPLRLTRALAPALRRARGALVNVNSVLSWFAVGNAHSVSKAGLWMATNAFRLEFAADGVGVLGVYPAAIDMPMQPGADRTGMLDPADVAAATFDAIENGDDELIIGDVARQVHSALAAPVTALYPQLAARQNH